MAWVELHFHLLPGVDDGPRSAEESVALAVAAVSEGTGTVAAGAGKRELTISARRRAIRLFSRT